MQHPHCPPTDLIRRRLLAAGSAMAAGAVSGIAHAQSANWPNKPLRWIVPYNPGGATDIVARLMAEHLGQRLGQHVIIENRAGAATTIGMQALLQSPADGYTLVTADNGTLYNNWHLFPKLGYTADSFDYVAMTGRFPLVLVVHRDVPARDFEEWGRWAKGRADGINYASPGVGSPHHIAMSTIADRLGIKLLHVPYKGDSAALLDVLGGVVPTMLVGVASVRQYMNDERIRLLAVTWPQRLSSLPQVPTFAEAGLKDFDVAAEQGILMAAGTPKPVIARINREVGAILGEAAVKEKLETVGMYPMLKSPEDFRSYVQKQAADAGGVIRRQGITIN